MSEEPKPEDLPRVFIGVPTGVGKDYAMPFMIAALQALEWGNAEIHWAVTTKGDSVGDNYLNKLQTVMDAFTWRCPWYIHTTLLTKEEAETPYQPIIRNRRLLRGLFLDGDCDYFFMVGGDNPPWRRAIKRLMKWDADVAFGVSYQRPKRDRYHPGAVYPMVWHYAWNMDEVPDDIEPELWDELWLTALNVTLFLPIYIDPNWKRKKRVWRVAGGDGNCLIKRRVLENVGWTLPGKWGSSYGYHSEDLHFFNKANLLGFTTVCDLKYHVPHLHTDGSIY